MKSLLDLVFPGPPDELDVLRERNRHQEAMARMTRTYPAPSQTRWESKTETRTTTKKAQSTPKGEAMRPEDV